MYNLVKRRSNIFVTLLVYSRNYGKGFTRVERKRKYTNGNFFHFFPPFSVFWTATPKNRVKKCTDKEV